MKRIIDGATYDTAKGTEIARIEYQDANSIELPGLEGVKTLYQSPRGAYFLVDVFTHAIGRRDDDGNWTRRTRRDFKPLSRERAQRWLLEAGDVVPMNIGKDLVLPEDTMADDDGATTMLLRMAPTLKARISQAAREAGVSINEYMIRCAERSVREVATT
jgi:predicted HicB family RNase H-like nuclease